MSGYIRYSLLSASKILSLSEGIGTCRLSTAGSLPLSFPLSLSSLSHGTVVGHLPHALFFLPLEAKFLLLLLVLPTCVRFPSPPHVHVDPLLL
uniref:Uncharacterized protein n=1 Tax=Arundo donax TaxID=35708 RepID=A0A0A9BRV3_ARUDO